MSKIVVAAPLEQDLQKPLERLKTNPLIKGSEIHLLHVVHLQYYFNEFSLYTYPMDDQFPEIQKTVLQALEQISKNIFSANNAPATITTTCLFHQDPKEQIVQYLKQNNADVAIVSTRGKHGIQGLFSSSCAEYLNKFSPCDLLILRPV